MPREEWRRPLSDVLDFAAGRLDARGLLPLDEARRIVGAATEFQVGERRQVGDLHFTDSDVLWGALLSLETPEEFARETRRLTWVHGPRALDGNIDPFTRFGDDVITWVAACVSPSGDLAALPPNLGTCLLQVASDAAWELAGRIASVGGRKAAGRALREEWVRRHADTAVRCALGSAKTDAWARSTLRRAADLGHVEAAAHVRPSRGARAGVTAKAILRELDRAYRARGAGDLDWPFFGIYDHSGCHHATRLVAAVRPGTTSWCVLLQQIAGDHPDWAEIFTSTYGTPAAPGWDEGRNTSLGVVLHPEEAEEDPSADVTVRGPAGECVVTPTDIADPTLAPEGHDPRTYLTVSRMRVYLRRFRQGLWPDAETLARSVLGEGPVRIVADTDRFRHLDDVRPSAQPVYRSLANALEHADPALFVAGEPNTWFDDPERRAADG